MAASDRGKTAAGLGPRARVGAAVAAAAVALSAALASPAPALAQGTVQMQRLYNPNSGEHFYTASTGERDHLVQAGWRYEGVGWVAPAEGDPVYRLYNPNAGDHHYTLSAAERDWLASLGWRYEGVGWMSDPARSVPLLRQYNPNAATGSHNFTTSRGESDHLVSLGWRAEGTGWWAVAAGGWTQPWAQGKRWVIDTPAWDETVTDPAWDEPAYEVHGYTVCNLCGAAEGYGEMSYEEYEAHFNRHVDAYLAGDKSQNYSSHSEERKVQVGTTHHDAVTHVVHHPAQGHWE